MRCCEGKRLTPTQTPYLILGPGPLAVRSTNFLVNATLLLKLLSFFSSIKMRVKISRSGPWSS